MSDRRYKVMLAQFPGNSVTHPDVADWASDTCLKMVHDDRIGKGNIFRWRESTTPVTKARNKALVLAEQQGCDFVLMLDNDMAIDYLIAPDGRPMEAGAEPFWDVAFDFAVQHRTDGLMVDTDQGRVFRKGPCVIAAPYCGPPPHSNVYVFQWANTQTDDPNPNFQISGYSRAEAARLSGIRECAALPTGVMLIDVEGVKRLPHPRFYYEYGDAAQTGLASTEDVTFSRDLWTAGVPNYCAWSSWAGHWKLGLVGKPYNIPASAVPQWLRKRADELPPVPEKRHPAPAHADRPPVHILPVQDAPPCPVPKPSAPAN